MAFVLMITFANAQTVESSRLFENFSVNVNGGITKSLNNVEDSTFFSNIKPSFGIEIDEDSMAVIIPRNSTIPSKKTKIFYNIEDNQISFVVNIFEGES